MDLQPYVDSVRHELNVVGRAGGDDAATLVDRLTAPLESAIRLVLLDALSAGAEEITRDLAPRSVEVRLRGRDPELVVTAPAAPELSEPREDDGGTWRITLRLPESLRQRVEAAARRDGVSLNAWLVRAAAARLEPTLEPPVQPASSRHHVTGWVR